ncbi:MAG: uroporphyrinogen-III synthase, partial [Acidimicrobiales bacterium]
ITFTSASAVSAYLAAVGAAQVPAVVACIGPVTAEAARSAGLVVGVVAPAQSIEALAEALAGFFSPRR